TSGERSRLSNSLGTVAKRQPCLIAYAGRENGAQRKRHQKHQEQRRAGPDGKGGIPALQLEPAPISAACLGRQHELYNLSAEKFDEALFDFSVFLFQLIRVHGQKL